MQELLEPPCVAPRDTTTSSTLDWHEHLRGERLPENSHRPAPNNVKNTTTIRSIFLSDVHLGCKHSHVEALLSFLEGRRPEHLYVVGDFLDGWKLQRQWYWDDAHSRLVQRIVEMSQAGTAVYYTPGNHDEFLRSFFGVVGNIQIQDEFIHTTVDARRFLVVHGDYFDSFEQNAKILSWIGDFGYERLMTFNRLFNRVRRRLGYEYWSISLAVKRKVKTFTSFLADFEHKITTHAKNLGCAGIVCGHLHTPAMRESNGITYCNTGDWVESCTALVEYGDGRLELMHQR